MRAIRWLWDGSPLVTGLVLGLLVFASSLSLGASPLVVGIGLGLAALMWLALVFLVQAMQFALMAPEQRRWRLRVFQSDYGCKGGWYVEKDEKRLALLTDPRPEVMFWWSYAVEPLVEDSAERSRIVSEVEWWNQTGLKFRSREFNIVAPTAFVGGCVFTSPGRVLIRGMHVGISPPTMREGLWMKWFAPVRPVDREG